MRSVCESFLARYESLSSLRPLVCGESFSAQRAAQGHHKLGPCLSSHVGIDNVIYNIIASADNLVIFH